MSTIDILRASSPFDAIKSTNGAGREWWSARSLMVLLGYEKWERFEDAIERAMLAAKNSGHDPEQAFSRRRENLPGGTKPRTDYLLSRFGAYLVAMNGDPRKARVAEAQAYFAVKTREAEVSAPQHVIPQTYAQALEVAARQAREIEEKDAELAAAAPKVESFNALMSADSSLRLGGAAKILGWQEKALREFLYREKLIFGRQAFCGRTFHEPYASFARTHFRLIETVVDHGSYRCGHTVLIVEQRGLELIRLRIAKRDAEIAAAITATDEPEPLPIST